MEFFNFVIYSSKFVELVEKVYNYSEDCQTFTETPCKYDSS